MSAITDHFRSVSHNTSVLCVVLDMRQSLQRLVTYEGYLVCGKRLTDQGSSGMDVRSHYFPSEKCEGLPACPGTGR